MMVRSDILKEEAASTRAKICMVARCQIMLVELGGEMPKLMQGKLSGCLYALGVP